MIILILRKLFDELKSILLKSLSCDFLCLYIITQTHLETQ